MKSFLLFTLLTAAAGAAVAEPLRIYLSPVGDDSNDGLTEGHSIQTLARAHDAVAQALALEKSDAEIRIASGLYSGQSVKWTFSMPDHTIAFMPVSDDAIRPIFDGGGQGSWFLFRRHTDGALTNFVFRNIQVQNYGTAISFSGERTKPKSSSRGNSIEGCYFLNIGEKSTAAVRFVNSSGNWIIGSRFVSIVSQSGGGFLHAIYAAHNSSDNLILQNRFTTCSGDPIRFRDASDRNLVQENRFLRTGEAAAVTDWFCDHERESDCTKPTAECPSWSNTVKDNFLDRNFKGDPLPAVAVYSDRIPSGCSKPTPDAQRFIVVGNHSP